jgi:drug/metabolite transporter (DMT)-like permease
VALILLAVLCFACLDTTAGWLGHRHPLLLMLWVRYGVQSMVMGLWVVVWAQRRRVLLPFRTEHPKFQATRGLLLLFSSAMTFLGATHMPVPEMTAINMLGPVLATVAAAYVLGERVSMLRRLLLLGGFAGAVIVIRPGSGLFGWVVLFPLGNTLAYTCFQLLTSRLSATENAYVTNFYTGLTGTALLTPVVIALGLDLQGLLMEAPAKDLLLLLALGLLGTGGHLLLILAFEQAPASALVPFTYAQIGAAALVAYLAFGHVPDGWAWVGMGIIAASGAVNAWLNMRASRQPVPPVQADTVAE